MVLKPSRAVVSSLVLLTTIFPAQAQIKSAGSQLLECQTLWEGTGELDMQLKTITSEAFNEDGEEGTVYNFSAQGIRAFGFYPKSLRLDEYEDKHGYNKEYTAVMDADYSSLLAAVLRATGKSKCEKAAENSSDRSCRIHLRNETSLNKDVDINVAERSGTVRLECLYQGI